MARQWWELLSCIDPNIYKDAVAAINTVPVVEKLNLIECWCYLSDITDQNIRNEAAAAVMGALGGMEKLVVAECWGKYLSKITDPDIRNKAAAAVMAAPVDSGEYMWGKDKRAVAEQQLNQWLQSK